MPASRRGVAGRLLVLGGTALLLTGAADWAGGASARRRARDAWEQRETALAIETARSAVELAAPGPRAAGAPVARIRIPRLAVDEVVVEGVEERDLRAGPGHLPETPLPGEPGNAAISAHRDRHFAPLAGLRLGDTIVTDTGLDAVTWVVTRLRVVDKEAPAIFPTRDATLTLTTCWPVRWFGSAPERLIVTAKPVAPR